MALESAFLAMMMIIVLNMVSGSEGNESSSPMWWIVFSALVLAPLSETILCQVIPVGIIRKLRGGFWAQVMFSNMIFAILHFWILGFIPGMTAGLIGGFYFGFTYVHWRRKGIGPAYWSTALVHFLYNFVILTAFILGG